MQSALHRIISPVLVGACLFVLSTAPAAANSKYAAYVVHAHSGDVLFDRYSNARRYPASLTKMMTLYLLFDELEAGRLDLSSKLTVSKRAAGQPPSKLGVKSGGKIDVETAIEALVVKSANDVAVVVAESIAGSEWRFAQKMTQKARALGMQRTTFRNASGLPNSRQVTTARDMATLSRRLMSDHPEYWRYFSTKSFTWNGRTYRTHNALVRSFEGADGLKTGYTRRSGYNLATSANRNGHQLVGIVLGGRSTRTRDAHMRTILTNAFSAIRKNPNRIAALYRKRPAPRLKPTALAAMAPNNAATGPAGAAAPTIADHAALQAKIAEAAGLLSAHDDDTLAGLITSAHNSPSGIEPLLAALDGADGLVEDPAGEGDREPGLYWNVQIGAYANKTFAQKELEAAAIAANLTDRARAISPTRNSDGRTVYRARFIKMSESEAGETCAALQKRSLMCFSVEDKPGAGSPRPKQ